MGKGDQSLLELKRINARVNETHQQLSQIIDARKGELRAAQEQLYVQIESFRVEQQHEIRNEIGVAVDFAIKALPWWKRWNRKNVLAEAAGYMVDLRDMRVIEARRVKAEIEAEAKQIEAERNAEAQAKAQAEFAAKAPMNAPLTPQEMAGNEKKGAGKQLQGLAQAVLNGDISQEEVKEAFAEKPPVNHVGYVELAKEITAGPFDKDGNVVEAK